ncbi:MAG: L-2-hydroxyglutarate oxidase [Chitinophagales bacterium]|nr:L-2-hydroxyglutarate oxidase [Chitinophagales bacterium]
MARKKIAIIGAGLVGLATALKLKELVSDIDIIILEKEREPALHQSSHNSGVIHSGIYYSPDSLKAKNCIRGYKMLLEFCDKYHVPYKICGKLIVATRESELPQLDKLYQRAQLNGLQNVKILNADEIKEKEPYIQALSALWVPQTGIIDFKALAQTINFLLNRLGVKIFFHQEVRKISCLSNLSIETQDSTYEVDYAINCAGLYSDRIALMTGLKLQHKIVPFKGEYFKIISEAAQNINGLVYPVPNPELPFLGVHITRMMSGKVEAGPNAILAFKREGYRKGDFSWRDFLDSILYLGFWRMLLRFKKNGFSEWKKSMSKNIFLKSVQMMMPSLKLEDISPSFSGVRAQAISQDGKLEDDFLIIKTAQMLHVCNAPSPAATSCLSIGQYIAEEVKLAIG